MGGEEMSTYLHGDKAYIRLIQCFLSPNLLIQCKENLNPFTDEETYAREVGEVDRNPENHFDFLYQVFDPNVQDPPGTVPLLYDGHKYLMCSDCRPIRP